MGNFWNDKNVEPKRSFRWVLRMPGDNNSRQIPAWIVKTVKKPSFTVSETTTQFVAHTFYYPGRITWDPVEITVIDPVTPDASARLVDILSASGYTLPTTEESAQRSFSRKDTIEALSKVEIVQIDASGMDIDKWTLWNAWVTTVDFGNLDYASEEMINLSFTLRYDYAEFAFGPDASNKILYGGNAS